MSEIDIVKLIKQHLYEHGCISPMVTITRIGDRLVTGLDGLQFGFVQVDVIGKFMNDVQDALQSVDLVLDQAIIDHIHFTKSRKTHLYTRTGEIKGVIKYEFKLLKG
jgi:hypothetical protein